MKVVFLRSDFWFGLTAGGSVTHVAGVLGGLKALGHDVTVFSTDDLHGVPPEVARLEVVTPWRALTWPKVRVLGPPLYNVQLVGAAARRLRRRRVDVVYQRHAYFGYAGVLLAARLRCPLVLEVNDLIGRWARERGERLRLGRLAVAVERRALRKATLLVAVSAVLRDQLVEEGVAPERIVVCPNGVDTERFRPDLSGEEVRRRLGLEGRTVVGFIGTFGSWHGVEELGRAIEIAARARGDVHFLLVGDGPRRAALEQGLEATGLADRVTFTGTVPAEDAPAHLAACDLFVSPHGVPRTGRFIGSPTKLFEYMAMGRGIVASALDQIADVLRDGETALLVPPGDAEALAGAILRLVADRELSARLGARAREAVVARYTWRASVSRLLEALAPHLPPSPDRAVPAPAGT